MAVTRRLRAACAVLLLATVTAACDTEAQFAPSLPPAAGFRVDDGTLKLWTGTPCSGVTAVTLIFETAGQGDQDQVWRAPKPGVTVERMDLLKTAGGSAPDTGGPLQVQKPLPTDFDWTKATSIVFYVSGPTANGAREDVAQLLRESPNHPSDSYLFGQQGWMNEADVQRENKKSFLTVCTPDPN
ncbi:hypothetical protein Adu01nite_33620 [Paractinoplanes durhamensis]|uniref:Lipoprotein n=1 Tax=Paractinoplanes durhamensis TaxID=113563 RepID=A0ABQ3YWQ0_9ACTN|nr:hypothetical protein Adu01nite_33620 [Actinoplanes durhamensis]